MGNVPTARGDRIWTEIEVQVYKVKRLEPDAGKAAKGILHIFEAERLKDGRMTCGQYRAIDVEDIITVNSFPTLTRK